MNQNGGVLYPMNSSTEKRESIVLLPFDITSQVLQFLVIKRRFLRVKVFILTGTICKMIQNFDRPLKPFSCINVSCSETSKSS